MTVLLLVGDEVVIMIMLMLSRV